MMFAGRPPEEVAGRLEAAWSLHPRSIGPLLALANVYEHGMDPPRLSEAAAAYEAVLARNPNELRLRLRYANVLERLGRTEAMREQLRQVLWYNDQLNPDEPERLSPQQVEQIGRLVGDDPVEGPPD